MKVITCVGYHDTGSGAVDDYFRGFDNIAQAKYGVECRFLQDPDCVSDLEYNLVENPHRLNSGFALKRFLKFVKANRHTYGLIFGNEWEIQSVRYVKDLTDFSYLGYWSGDMMLMPFWKRSTYYCRRGVNRFVPKSLKKPSTWNYFPNEKTLHCSVSEDVFLKKTKKYVASLLNAINPEKKEYVVLDQAVSAINVHRYLRYFPYDTKVIVVDRDPRDVFIEETILKGRVLPKDVREFCAVYRDSRKKHEQMIDDDKVLRINFEDLIYHYTDTINRICSFTGLKPEMYNSEKSGFDPSVSIKNTRLWEMNHQFDLEVTIISDLLEDFLYENYS